MKVIILAGGLPSTLIEEDEKMPKPMAEIGGRPMLWHIMKQYAYYGYNDFIICTGYKGEVIKDYFMNFYIYQSDITVDLQTNEVEIHRKQTEDWKVSIVDTGLQSSVMERLIMVRELAGDEPVLPPAPGEVQRGESEAGTGAGVHHRLLEPGLCGLVCGSAAKQRGGVQ